MPSQPQIVIRMPETRTVAKSVHQSPVMIKLVASAVIERSIRFMPPAVSAPAVFNVVDYGADPTGVEDSTAAVVAALDAAGAVASAESPQVVYFPDGNYMLMPAGRAYVTVYRKAAGAWGSALVTDAATDQVIEGFHLQSTAPEASDGTDGDLWFDATKGRFYRKASGLWDAAGKIMDGSGAGWIAAYSATAAYPEYVSTPDDAAGADGDYAVMFRLVLATGSAIDLARTRHDHLTLSGESAAGARLFHRCWSDEDPADYTYSGTTVLTSRIPPSMDTRPYAIPGQPRYARGQMFGMDDEGGSFGGLHFEHLTMDGGTTASGNKNHWTSFDTLHGWDELHKCMRLNRTNTAIRHCVLVGWRGEIVYKGGTHTLAEILIENCEISESNGSAVSISGGCTIDGCTITAAYNGCENYCHNGQYTVIRNSHIDARDSEDGWRGQNAVVYIGTGDSYLHISGSRIEGGLWSAVFLSEAASSVQITDTVLANSAHGIYYQHLSQYSAIPDPHFDELTLTGVTFEASSQDMTDAILTYHTAAQASGWVFDALGVAEQNGYSVINLSRDRNRNISMHDVTVINADVAATNPWREESKLSESIAAWMWGGGNSIGWTEKHYYGGTGDRTLFAGSPRYSILSTGNDGVSLAFAWNADQIPEGFTMVIRYAPTNPSYDGGGVHFHPAPWNTLTDSIAIKKNQSAAFVYSSADDKFSLV